MLENTALDYVVSHKLSRLMSTKNTIGKAIFVDTPDLFSGISTWSRPEEVIGEGFTTWNEIYGLLRQDRAVSYPAEPLLRAGVSLSAGPTWRGG